MCRIKARHNARQKTNRGKANEADKAGKFQRE
jgi:hypothetical protein